MDPIVLPPLRERLSPNRSKRRGQVSLVVVHRPVGSYRGSIDALCDPAHEASAHVILAPGGKEATQLVPWGEKAWACMSFNSVSDNLEIADSAWTGNDEQALKVAARIVAFRLHKRGLPAKWVRGNRLLTDKGFTRHYDLGAIGGGHTDPTTDQKYWLRFCRMVAAELERGGFRDTWGR
jgi:hypothetical protein